MTEIITSIETLVEVLTDTLTELYVEKEMRDSEIEIDYESLPMMREAIVKGLPLDDKSELIVSMLTAKKMRTEHPEVLMNVLPSIQSSVLDYLKGLKEWFVKKFAKAKDKLEELAHKIIDEAKNLGATIAEVLRRMQTKIIEFLLKGAVVNEFTVGSGTASKIFNPIDVTFSYSIKGAPVLPEMTITSIVGFLKSLPEFSITVSAKYQ
ncbi:MAG: hypothetical protein H3Z49_04120 [archaeon]|nr:hypothetical protein [archaeon]